MAKRKLKEPVAPWISYHDLPVLEPVMEQVQNVCKAKHVSLEDFFKLFDPSVHEGLKGLALRYGVTHLVCFENLDLCSSQLGHRSAAAVGESDEKHPGRWTLEFILQTPYARLGRGYNMQFPVVYASTDALKRAEKQLNLSLEGCAA